MVLHVMSSEPSSVGCICSSTPPIAISLASVLRRKPVASAIGRRSTGGLHKAFLSLMKLISCSLPQRYSTPFFRRVLRLCASSLKCGIKSRDALIQPRKRRSSFTFRGGCSSRSPPSFSEQIRRSPAPTIQPNTRAYLLKYCTFFWLRFNSALFRILKTLSSASACFCGESSFVNTMRSSM